jgi:hypothetical protein
VATVYVKKKKNLLSYSQFVGTYRKVPLIELGFEKEKLDLNLV